MRVHSSTAFNKGNFTIKIVKMSNSRCDNMVFDQYKLSKVANFGTWKFNMKNVLMHEMLWHLVSPDPTREIMEDDSTIVAQQ